MWALDTHKSTAPHYAAWGGLIAVCLKILAHPRLRLRMLGWQDSHVKTALHYAADGILADIYRALAENTYLVSFLKSLHFGLHAFCH